MSKKFRILALLFSTLIIFAASNAFASSSNLVPNASVENVSSSNANLPDSWSQHKWGTNDAQFNYLNSGHSGNRSLNVQIANYTSGDAKWEFTPVNVTPGALYTYSDYYESNVTTEIGVFYTDSTGATTYKYVGSPAASPNSWNLDTYTITAPANAVSASVVHLLAKVGYLQTDDFNLSQLSVPQVSINTPTNNISINGITSLSAAASDNDGLTSVQFRVDNLNVGSPISNSPFQYFWDSSSVPNGVHSITAVATNIDGISTVSNPVSVNVNNQASSQNLIPNGSLEYSDPTKPNVPLNWLTGGSGVNTSIFNFLTTLGHSGTRSVNTQITQYTSGSVHWRSNSVPIIGGQMYDYSEYYESNVKTSLNAAITMSDGSIKYMYLQSPSASPNSWTNIHQQFVMPVGAVSVSMYHELQSVGWLTTDDYSLNAFSYVGFNRPIISITDDDGFASFYNNGLPILKKYNLKSTDYIISNDPNRGPTYMSTKMIKSLYTSGQEIGSHTVTHPDLTTLTNTQLTSELANSQTWLQNLLGVPVTDFAAPFGTYNQQVIDAASQYYQTYRTVQAGFNAKNNFNKYNILVQNIHSDTTLAQVQSWISQAELTNTWLVLVYHQVDPSTTAGIYNTYPTDFDSQMSAIRSSGIAVETVAQAMQEIQPQL